MSTIRQTQASEREELRHNVRRFFAAHSAESDVRQLMASPLGFDPEVWNRLGSQELGVLGLHVPEEYGGAGYSFGELCVVLEEAGAALLCAPLLSSAVLATCALLQSGDVAACQELLPGLVSGERRGTLALNEAGAGWDDATMHTQAVRSGASYRITGEKSYVVDGASADILLVVARTDSGIGLFRVLADEPGVSVRSHDVLDQTRHLAAVDFNEVHAESVGRIDAGWSTVQTVLHFACIALAAEQVGGAQRTLDMAVEYARNRIQFSRPIGSFQAIKHKCADMLIAVESARASAEYAISVAAEGGADLPIASALVKAWCSDAFLYVAGENIQVHGGLGFTWEHPAHLYFKRAKADHLMFGDPASYRERLGDLLAL